MRRGREEEEPLKKTGGRDGNRLVAGKGAGAGHCPVGTGMGWELGGKSCFLWPRTGEAEWGVGCPRATPVGYQPLGGGWCVDSMLGWGRGWLTAGHCFWGHTRGQRGRGALNHSHPLLLASLGQCGAGVAVPAAPGTDKEDAASPTLACCFLADWGARKTQG